MMTNITATDGFQHALKWMELAYYICGVLLVLIGLYASRQVLVMKNDINTRNERAAKEKAIEYASRYLGHYVELAEKLLQKLLAENLPTHYEGPIIDSNFKTPIRTGKYHVSALQRFTRHSWLCELNELQSIAAAYIAGVADEKVGFSIIGRSYCFTVRGLYDILSFCRTDKAHPYYESIIQLYSLWSPRLAKAELDEEANQLNGRVDELKSKSGEIPDKTILPIGVTR